MRPSGEEVDERGVPIPRKEKVLIKMDVGWKEDEGDSRWTGTPVQLVSAHQMSAPRNTPMAQSVKLCMAV